MSLSIPALAQAAGASYAEAQKLMAPKGILAIIKNFFTCGGVTRANMELLDEFKTAVREKIDTQHPQHIQFQFMEHEICISPGSSNRTFTCTVKGHHGDEDSTEEINCGYHRFLASLTSPAQSVSTSVSARGNSADANKLLNQYLGAVHLPPFHFEPGPDGNPTGKTESDCVRILSARAMVDWKTMASVCDDIQQQAVLAAKPILAPLGLINRPLFYEPHMVLLVCIPDQLPKIVDSKNASPYPHGISVEWTGCQPFLDRQSCWAHACQQAIHYAHQLTMGVPAEQLTFWED